MNKEQLFPKKELKKLIWPLLLEQTLAITIGLADTVMVSRVGEAAVSGVSLVDMVNMLLFNIFAALATGGAVVVSQLLGARQRERACEAGRQLIFVITLISLGITMLVIACRGPLLRLLFGTIEDEVMQAALLYLLISALSYPFLAVYNAGAALFRAQGNSDISMKVAALVNVLNIGGNAVLIFGFHLGVLGAASASAFARLAAAVLIMVLLRNPQHTVSLADGKRFRPERALIGRILGIGIPNGVENSLFQLGRIAVVSIIALFGTTQIAANAVANNLDALAIIPGQAINLAMITVIGRCVGAGDRAQARFYTKKLLKIGYLTTGTLCALVIVTLPLTMRLYQLSAETMQLAELLIIIHCGGAILLWPVAFCLPNALRAASDVRFTMIVAIASVWLFRIGGGYVLAVPCNLGAIGIWIAMLLDWIVRTIAFVARYRGDKWLSHAVQE